MDFIKFFDAIPFWGILLLAVGGVLLSIEAGVAIGLWDRRNNNDADKVKAGAAVGASLGLLAFILAFTFGATTSRYDDRRELLLSEANAIGTTYLRADLLSEPYGEQARELLRAYTVQRYQLALEGSEESVERGLAAASEVQTELWAVATAASRQAPSPITGLFVSALNEVFDMHQNRVTVSLQRRMPKIFWLALFTLTFLTMLLGGYETAVTGSPRRWFANMGVAVAFGVVLFLVIMLDRPFVRLGMVDHGPYIDLQRSMGVDVPLIGKG